jgi:hypothetical protein
VQKSQPSTNAISSFSAFQAALAPATSIPEQWSLLVAFWKHLFSKSAVFSMPRALFDACDPSSVFDGGANFDVISRALERVSLGVPPAQLSDDSIFFQVTNPHPERRFRLASGSAAPARSRVNIHLFNVQSMCAESQSAIVVDHEESHKTIDVRGLVVNVVDALPSVTRWKIVGRQAVVKPKNNLPELATDVYESYALPFDVGSESSELALVVRPAADAVHARDSAAEQDALAQIVRRGAAAGAASPLSTVSVPFHSIGAHIEVINALERAGAIAVQNDEFGESYVALQPSGLVWSLTLKLSEPVPAMCCMPDAAPLQTPKFVWMVRLHDEGWSSDPRREGSWADGSALVCRAGTNQPTSYFACLVLRRDLLTKGVSEIRHRMPDAYYKCLLFLEGDALRSTLDDLAGRSNEWFVQRLRDSPEQSGQALVDEDAEPAVPLPALGGGDVLPIEDQMQLVPVVAVSSEWTRCIASTGPGTSETKIYLDHSSHQSGRQRGWVNCSIHGCIKYEFCVGDRREFCAYLHAWRCGDHHAACGSKREHLCWKPAEDEVSAVLERLVLRDF